MASLLYSPACGVDAPGSGLQGSQLCDIFDELLGMILFAPLPGRCRAKRQRSEFFVLTTTSSLLEALHSQFAQVLSS